MPEINPTFVLHRWELVHEPPNWRIKAVVSQAGPGVAPIAGNSGDPLLPGQWRIAWSSHARNEDVARARWERYERERKGEPEPPPPPTWRDKLRSQQAALASLPATDDGLLTTD